MEGGVTNSYDYPSDPVNVFDLSGQASHGAWGVILVLLFIYICLRKCSKLTSTIGRLGARPAAGAAGTTARKIANNTHTWRDHAEKDLIPNGVTSRGQLATRIESTITNGESKVLLRDRTAYWDDGFVVIRDARSTAEGGTAFFPDDGYQYFLTLE